MWAAAGEVCGRCGEFREACRALNLAYVVIIPRDAACQGTAAPSGGNTVSAAGLQFCRHGAPLPSSAGQPCPPGIPPIGLSGAETARIERLARDWKAGLLTAARLAFRLRWSAWRRQHQARARWHHYSTRLQALAT